VARLPEAPARPLNVQLLPILAFAAGMAGISISPVIQTQLDKMILGENPPAGHVRYYTSPSSAEGLSI